jgi:hypothetical protein
MTQVVFYRIVNHEKSWKTLMQLRFFVKKQKGNLKQKLQEEVNINEDAVNCPRVRSTSDSGDAK